MVDKNLAGSAVKRTNFFAFLFPSAAIFSIFISFIDIIAVSAQAKIAFKPIKATCSNIINKIEFPKIFSSKIQSSNKDHFQLLLVNHNMFKRKKTKPILTLASRDYAQTCYQYYTLMEAYYPEYRRLRPFLSTFSFLT